MPEAIRMAFKTIVTFCELLQFVSAATDPNNLRLKFGSPGKIGNTSKEFVNAFPIGNGRLGGAIYGQPVEEVITINEDSIWSGPEVDRISKIGLGHLPSVQRSLLNGDITGAQHEAIVNMVSNPQTGRSYAFLGDVALHFDHGNYSHYSRVLDMENATVSISYDVDGVVFERTFFASYPDKVIIGRITSTMKKALSFSARWNRLGLNESTRNGCVYSNGKNTVTVNAEPVDGPPHYAGQIFVTSPDGQVSITENIISVVNASEATILISVETDYWNENASPNDLDQLVSSQVANAHRRGFSLLQKRHISDFRQYFDRTSLSIGSVSASSAKDTNLRYAAFNSTGDLGLVVNLFQFGRYLYISSSRPGSLPPNLVGIWNNNDDPAWDGAFTTDLNVEMFHWQANLVGLSDLQQPLFDFTQRRVMPNGGITAKALYNCSGWVAHTNNDLWGDTAPWYNGTTWTFWPTGGAWPMVQAFEHYRFTGDKGFLRYQVLPILTGLVEFFNDFLIEKDGYLVTAPSISPENSYLTPENVTGGMTFGPTSDNQILREIYKDFLLASDLLGSTYLVERAKTVLSKIRSPVLGDTSGRIRQWWYADFEPVQSNGAMMAPLLALHPFAQINYWDSPPEWITMAEKTIEFFQSDPYSVVSWWNAWPIIYYARLRNGKMAYDSVKRVLNNVATSGATWTLNNGEYQIDGNLGAVAGIAEMLLQSQGPEFIYPMYILPALPHEWPEGSVTNLGARGGFEVSIWWKDGLFSRAEIRSNLGRPLNATVGSLGGSEFTVKGAGLQSEKGHVEFDTTQGKVYTLTRAW
ncbi:hypothetical protein N7474_001692 [Penicillium riverlandense]|uniref:uncharacterized protein n=1 Tax=Penicillium riverlandense TaxID=1903569 RepID=UPI00254951A2|nr:uncharacterized protein N7474_001692 [Penicillium riverlandense]KAJ5833381.1 hypothetical protein N7474_001692 [Penicillium riverlandense]